MIEKLDLKNRRLVAVVEAEFILRQLLRDIVNRRHIPAATVPMSRLYRAATGASPADPDIAAAWKTDARLRSDWHHLRAKIENQAGPARRSA